MLLERETAIRSFQEALNTAKSSGKVLLLSGEAGIGKTSLLEHVRQSANDTSHIFWSGCDPLFTPQPFAPIHDFAQQFAPALFPLLNIESKITQVGNRIPAAFFQSLEQLEKPAVLIIEDVHWADNATLDLLQYVVRRISFVPCLLCLSYRDDEVTLNHPFSRVINLAPSAHTIRIPLTRLNLQSVIKLAEGTSNDPEKLLAISSGNPFFISELLASRDVEHKNLPSSIRDAVGSRLARLNEEERKLLNTLCLIPNSIPMALIEQLFENDIQASLATCLSKRLLSSDTNGECRFNHELSRLSILSMVPPHQQKQIHAQILTALKSLGFDDNLAWLIHHAEAALDHISILKYAPKAAQAASELGAHKESASYYLKALKHVEYASTELAAQLYENWAYEAGLTTQTSNSVIEARRTAITLYRALNKKEKVAENLRYLSRLYWYKGESERAEQLANEAISAFEQLPASSELAMAYSMRSQLDMLNDRTEQAVFWGHKALEIEKQFNKPLVKVHALTNVGSALLMHGDSSGEGILRESLALSLENGLHEEAARVYTNFSDYCVRFKLLDLAEEMTTKGIQFDIAHELDSWTYYLVGLQAQLRLEQGRLIDAQTIAQGVKSLKNQTILMQLPALIVEAKAQLRLDIDTQPTQLQEAFKNASSINEHQYLIPVRLAFIEQAWLLEEASLALEHVHALSSIADNILNTWQIGELLVWHQRLKLTILSTAKIEDLRKKAAVAYQLELNAEHAASGEKFMSLNMPYNAALAFMHANDLSGKDLMQKAIDILESMHAQAALKRLRIMASQRGLDDSLSTAKRGPYKKTRQHPAQLTSKEQTVLKLLVTGASNQEIAEAMSRSQRTVENHVSSILAKLSVNNRIEAILRVQNEPWLV